MKLPLSYLLMFLLLIFQLLVRESRMDLYASSAIDVRAVSSFFESSQLKLLDDALKIKAKQITFKGKNSPTHNTHA